MSNRVEASRRNLEALKISANSLRSDIEKLNRQKLKFIDENNVKEADKVVEEINRLNDAWNDQNQMIKAQEAELNNYANILDNLTNTRLTDLHRAPPTVTRTFAMTSLFFAISGMSFRFFETKLGSVSRETKEGFRRKETRREQFGGSKCYVPERINN